MANQWNATLATQTVPFRGTSTVQIKTAQPAFPEFRAIEGSAYSLLVTGGVSGAFGVNVLGNIGSVSGTTVVIAGLTNITAAGTYVLFPYGYSTSGTGALVTAPPIDSLVRIDWIVPPTQIQFQSGVATAGISANCTVSGCLITVR